MGEVVVRCDHVAGQATPPMQHPGQRDGQRFAFAGGHLHQQAFVHGQRREHLDGIRGPLNGALGRHGHRCQ